jgi:trans-aconitate methyltransferase
MPVQPGLWSGSEAYERYMGRWSRRVAARFADWIGAPPQSAIIDVGCGTGALAAALLGACDPARLVGVDSAPALLDAAREQVRDPRASFAQGDAQALPGADGAFDVAVSGLVLNFVPDKEAMIREMARVVRPGGTVALYVWDYAGHMQIMRHFFDAATALDPGAREFDDGVKAPVCRPEPLRRLFSEAGLASVEVRAIDITTEFADFDDYWTPFLGGTGSAPKYCQSLDEPLREQVRESVRRRLPTGPDGEILLAVRAWAVKGRVAG